MFPGLGLVVILACVSYEALAHCPLPCKCADNQVDCTRAGLDEIPTNLDSNVTALLLGWNQLTRLPTDSLTNYPNLRKLVLNHNQIETIELEHEQVENLDLADNHITDLSFLLKFPKLRHLNLTNNKLTELDNNSLSSNSKLLSLVIHNNPIRQLDEATFRRNNLLSYLSLAGLEIDSIPARLLDPLTRLHRLEIRNNSNLNSLRDETFYYLGNLRFLDMSYNNLSSLPRSLRHLESLRSLSLDGNAFTCDCRLFWFANWLEKRPSISTSSAMQCLESGSPLVESLWRLHCSAVRLEMSTLFQQAPMGDPILLTCNFSGTPTPNVTWVTPDRKILHYPELILADDVTLVSGNQLKVNRLSRDTAGSYACHASNALSNVTAFMRIQITPKGFRRVEIQSIIAGFIFVGAFVLITFIVQGVRYLMDRYCTLSKVLPMRELTMIETQVRLVRVVLLLRKAAVAACQADPQPARGDGAVQEPAAGTITRELQRPSAPHSRQLRTTDGQDPPGLPRSGQVRAGCQERRCATPHRHSRSIQRSGTAPSFFQSLLTNVNDCFVG